VALPPAFSYTATSSVLIAGLAIHDRFRRPLRPHGCEAIRNVVAGMTGLAGLEIQPVSFLVLVIAVMRPVMDSGGLVVRVPGLDLSAASLDLGLSS
jgi:hypothetical protein